MVVKYEQVEGDTLDIHALNKTALLINRMHRLMEDAAFVVEDIKVNGPDEVLAVAATQYKRLVDLEDAIDQLRLKAWHTMDHYKMRVLPKLFAGASTDQTTTLDGHRVKMSRDLAVSIKADTRDEAYQWLVDNGLGDIITSTVNSSTLKATVKAIDEKNLPLPPEDLFTITPLPKYSVTRMGTKLPKRALVDDQQDF